jgi:hypothetical protein
MNDSPAPLLASLCVLVLLTVQPIPQVDFVLQIASGVALLIGGPLALRAQRRYRNANTWRVMTCWGLFGAGGAIIWLLWSTVR